MVKATLSHLIKVYLPSHPVCLLLGGQRAPEDLEGQNPPSGTDKNEVSDNYNM